MKDKAIIWRQHMDRHQKSSLSIQAYCDQHQLSSGMYYYWKRKLNAPSPRDQFTELQIVGHVPGIQSIHVRFPTGVEMWLEGGTEATFLRVLAGLVVSPRG